jgi:predicted methyltransferase
VNIRLDGETLAENALDRKRRARLAGAVGSADPDGADQLSSNLARDLGYRKCRVRPCRPARTMRPHLLLTALILFALALAHGRAPNTFEQEVSRLAVLLEWRSGSVVGEIGAGEGDMTLLASEHVGPAGRVYTTELDPKKLAHLEELAAKATNITALKAAESTTNLPEACCDSMFMRLVYHHFTHPSEMDASLYKSLKPGGLLAVMDREPPAGSSRVEGVPENRMGHGVPQKVLIQELASAGFEIVKVENDWPSNLYCVVCRKPGASNNVPSGH